MAPDRNPNNLSWEEYRYHLTRELERMSGILETMADRLAGIENKQTVFETAHSRDAKWLGAIWGFCAAALVEAGRVLVGVIAGRK